jgi:hypothetical protein
MTKHASSTELSTISQTRWWSPLDPTPPMHARAARTAQASRTVMFFAV